MAKRKFGLICLPFLLISAGFVFFGFVGTGWAKSDETSNGAVTHIGFTRRVTTYPDKADSHGKPFGDFEEYVNTFFT